MHVEGISAVDAVTHKAQMSLQSGLQVLRPSGGRAGSLGESNHGKCGFADNLNGQNVRANKAPLV